MPDNEIRDRLVRDLFGAHTRHGRTPDAMVGWRGIAADLLAKGWRPPARVIESVEDAEALPDDTIIRTRYGTAAQRIDEAWEIPNEVGRCLSEALELPATVLWTPEEARA